MDRYKLFIFDWDGTLSTSTSIVRVSRFVKSRYNIKNIEHTKELYKVDAIKEINSQVRLNRAYAFIYDIYSRFSKPKLKDGAEDLLRLLKKKGKKVAIFSDSNRHRLFIETRKLGVTKYVDFILSADSIKKFKPNPTGLIAIANRFKLNRKQCLYVGDMASDIYTAKFAGMDSCAVCDGIDPEELLKMIKPVYIAKSIRKISTM